MHHWREAQCTLICKPQRTGIFNSIYVTSLLKFPLGVKRAHSNAEISTLEN